MSKPVFCDLFTLSGRRNRKSYFIYLLSVLLLGLVYISLILTTVALDSNNAPTGAIIAVSLLIWLPLLFSQLAVGAQRCRDFGWTGWSILIELIPFVGWIFPFVMLFLPGTVGPNRYGPDPLDRTPLQFSKNPIPESKNTRRQVTEKLDGNYSTSSDSAPLPNRFSGDATLENDAYKLFLLRTYHPKKEDVLGKISCCNKLFDTSDEALKFADSLYRNHIQSSPSGFKETEEMQLQTVSVAAESTTSSTSSLSASGRYRTIGMLVIAGALGVAIAGFLAKYQIFNTPSIKHSNSTRMLENLRQGMPYSEARAIILNSGWQATRKHFSEVSEYGNESAIYYKNGWHEVVDCAGTGLAPCTFLFHDINARCLHVGTIGECGDEDACDPPVNAFRIEDHCEN